eukprot:COSAG01_NODE_913_length_12779_cov_9.134385_10_plen_168_part_00
MSKTPALARELRPRRLKQPAVLTHRARSRRSRSSCSSLRLGRPPRALRRRGISHRERARHRHRPAHAQAQAQAQAAEAAGTRTELVRSHTQPSQPVDGRGERNHHDDNTYTHARTHMRCSHSLGLRLMYSPIPQAWPSGRTNGSVPAGMSLRAITPIPPTSDLPMRA